MVTNPTIAVISPAPNSINNPVDVPIVFQLQDAYGPGLAVSSLTVTIQGNYAIENGVFQPGYNGSITLASSSTSGPYSTTYAILASSTITNVGSTNIIGNVGLYPGTSVTGFPPGTFSGTENIANSNASTAQASALTAYNVFKAESAGASVSVLDGLTLAPGTYTSATSMSLATSGNATLTLNGSGTYIFQIGSTLTTGAGGVPTINLINGASAADIYWVVGSSATINSGFAGTFYGNVLAYSSITVTSGGTINGTLAALNGAVTLSAATNISVVTSPSYSVINVVVNQVAPYTSLERVQVSISVTDVLGVPAPTTVYSFIGIDNVPPTIINPQPMPGSIQIPANQVISFDIRTTPVQTAINLNSLVVSIAGLAFDAYGNIALDGYGNPVLTPFIYPDSLGQIYYDHRQVSVTADTDGLGYTVSIIPLTGIPLSDFITVYVDVANGANNVVNYSYSFASVDLSPPSVTNEFPLPNSTLNSIATPISFTVGDQVGQFVGSGVNLNTLSVIIDGNQAMQNGAFSGTFTGMIAPDNSVNGYDITIANSILYTPRKTIAVQITVSDNSSNLTRTSYYFTTESTIPPVIVYVYPQDNAVNIPQDATLIINIANNVAVQELDLNTISVAINDIPVFANNSFQAGYTGSIFANNTTTLTITLFNSVLYALGSTLNITTTAGDVFGNITTASATFVVTNILTLASMASPTGGIYGKAGSSGAFPQVGSFLLVTLTTNRVDASIAYTLDGSDPAVDGYFNVLGTTQIYTTQLRITNQVGGIVRFFAFDPNTDEIELPNHEIYVFSSCPEQEIFTGTGLLNGNEYTDSVQLTGAQYTSSAITNQLNSSIGIADYVHDLGRLCYIDALSFQITGISHFRVRVADTEDDLSTTTWLNQLLDIDNGQYVTIENGYGPQITIDSAGTHIDGYSLIEGPFADVAQLTIVPPRPLLSSFQLQGDMRLVVEVDQVVGAYSFFRLFDTVYTLEVQQYVAKASTSNLVLNNENALLYETPEITYNGVPVVIDGYTQLTNGYPVAVSLQSPNTNLTDVRDFTNTVTVQIASSYTLPPNTTGVFSIVSQSASIYNTFDYGSGVTYSSALIGVVNYKTFLTADSTAFALSVTGCPLDSTLATIVSENFSDTTSQYVPAETNNVWTTTVFLEAGDYNFRYQVTTITTARIVANPFTFQTIQNLSTVQYGDVLVVRSASYPIESVVKLITSEYVIEFQSAFPQSAADILTWTITRSGNLLMTSTSPITVINISNAGVGFDASGALGNIIVAQRQNVTFTYVSADAIAVSLISTFNNYDPTQNILVEEFNPVPILQAFDLDLTTIYTNNYLDYNRVTATPLLPMIVNTVRFYTGVSAADKQRTRLYLDSIPITKAVYTAYTEANIIATYTNSVDVYTSIADGYDEWRYSALGTPNTKFHDSIALVTRFDSYSGNNRQHEEIQIYTLPNIPLIVSDFYMPFGTTTLYRSKTSATDPNADSRTGFASSSNYATIVYATSQQLSAVPSTVISVQDNGLVNNFLQATIVAPGPTLTSVYLDRPNLFVVGSPVITYDGTNIARSTVASLPTNNSGLVQFTSNVLQSGIVVQDYQLVTGQNSIEAQIIVPNFRVVFQGTIADFGTNLTVGESTFQALAGQTLLVLQNYTNIQATQILGGRLTYPTLASSAKIVAANNVTAIANSITTNYLVLTINQELTMTQDTLGAIIETFNTTQVVTDYIISTTDGVVQFVNQSLLSSGTNTSISYTFSPVPYQIPSNMLCISANPTDIITISIDSTNLDVELTDVSALRVSFFNGVTALAPSTVQFTLNDNYIAAQSITSATIIDGYLGSLYNPSLPNTGQILQYVMPIDQIDASIDGYVEGYGPQFTSMAVTFTGQSQYCIGQVEAIANTTVTNSICRITLNQEEIYLSSLPVSGAFTRIQMDVDRGIVLITMNGTLVIRYPLVLQHPQIQFGAAGKALGDVIEADFANIMINQYFVSSPAKVEEVGRFIEIEGTVIS